MSSSVMVSGINCGIIIRVSGVQVPPPLPFKFQFKNNNNNVAFTYFIHFTKEDEIERTYYLFLVWS